MARFKKVALKDSDQIDDLFEYDEPELLKDNMDLSKINIYLHEIKNMTGLKLFKMKLFYGKVANDLSF